jgi:plastocyanin
VPVLRALLLTISACLLVLVLAACGSSGSSGSSSSSASPPSSKPSSTPAAAGGAAGHGALSVAADSQGQLKFDPSTLSAKAGKVTIAFTNSAPVQHNLTIEQGTGTNGTILGSTPTFTGGTKTIVANLTPGTYVYYCSVLGHRAAGMHGTLTVR